jgi:pimeloyl-ACP methyl ester carboxylesterase
MAGIEDWWAAGERVTLRDWAVFVRRMGSGPSMTLLHGFPSSSYDWAKVAPALAEHSTLLMPDLLGFGASDKPAEHEYSLFEQADLVEALWAADAIESTDVVAHDYSVTIAQELLHRRAEGRLQVELRSVTLLNGGLYPGIHRPQPTQYALLDPEQGPQISANMTEELFVAALEPTWGEGFDGAADARDIWASIAHATEIPVLHRTIAYMTDREVNAERWTGALEATDVPLKFVWGMQDPISGAHMAEHIRGRIPGAQIVALDDVGHWPMLEAPDRVAPALIPAQG